MSYSGWVTELRFEHGTSSKFYRVYVLRDDEAADYRVLCQWGRIGAPNGQCKVETFAGPASAQDAALTKRDAKLGKGYEQHWHREYDVVPADVLEMAAVNERSQQAARVQASNDPFVGASVLLDQAMRLTTGDLTSQAQAVVVSRSLREQLDTLRTRLLELEGAAEIVDMTIAHKIGLS